uniref:Uncharacterized protein n=1 Tax=Coccolithus braarudii TaxID=221442 RepID=A0A7S0PYC4_9EUKA|mmetsp:Transcript_26348/g.56861  ORF Transcript_26348/g.56861 Transcript_26348/m.56861 type:complete len:412 (+) Transcript_26348:125-1360(+)
MLLADKHDLQERLKLQLVHIEDKELNFYTQNCYTVGTQAALLSGFAFSALNATPDWEEGGTWLQVFWSLSTVLAMLFEIMTVVKSMQLSIMGPGLALRGPEGSMTRAVLVMRSEYKSIHRLFYLGLICFHISAVLIIWVLLEKLSAAMNTVLIFGALVWLYVDFSSLEKRLRLPSRADTYEASNFAGRGDHAELQARDGSSMPCNTVASCMHCAGGARGGEQRGVTRGLQATRTLLPRLRNPYSKGVAVRNLQLEQVPELDESPTSSQRAASATRSESLPSVGLGQTVRCAAHEPAGCAAAEVQVLPLAERSLSVAFHVVQGGPESIGGPTAFTSVLPVEATLGDARDVAAAELRWPWTAIALYIEIERGHAEPVGLTVETLATPLHVLCDKIMCTGSPSDPLNLWIIKKE